MSSVNLSILKREFYYHVYKKKVFIMENRIVDWNGGARTPAGAARAENQIHS